MAGFSAATWVLAKAAGAGAASEAIEGLGEGLHFKGIVNTPNDLPSTHNDGDMWIITDMNPSAPGNQGGKAVWYGSQWNYFDQIPSQISQLENDVQYLTTKVNIGSYVDNIHVDGNTTTPPSNTHEYVISSLQFKRNVDPNYVPKQGEPVFEQSGSTFRLKIGNGTTKYSSLPYIGADFVPATDSRSVNIAGTNLQVYGFSTAPLGTFPVKSNGGLLEWIKLEDILSAGVANELVTTSTGNKINVLFDGTTIKVNGQNKLYVPVDNDTIKSTGSGLTAKKPVAGTGIKVERDTNQDFVISSTYKAGNNVTFETKTDGIYINSTGSGGGGTVANIVGKDGVKATTVGSTTTVTGDYVAGNYININKKTNGQMEISVDQTAVENTYRPVKLNGTELLSEEASTGFVDFESQLGSATGIEMTGITHLDGAGVRMQIANTGIIQAQEVGLPHRALSTLTGRQISLHCGNADFSGALHH